MHLLRAAGPPKRWPLTPPKRFDRRPLPRIFRDYYYHPKPGECRRWHIAQQFLLGIPATVRRGVVSCTSFAPPGFQEQLLFGAQKFASRLTPSVQMRGRQIGRAMQCDNLPVPAEPVKRRRVEQAVANRRPVAGPDHQSCGGEAFEPDDGSSGPSPPPRTTITPKNCSLTDAWAPPKFSQSVVKKVGSDQIQAG